MKRIITLGLIASAFCAQAAFATQCRHQKSGGRYDNTTGNVSVTQTNAPAGAKKPGTK